MEFLPFRLRRLSAAALRTSLPRDTARCFRRIAFRTAGAPHVRRRTGWQGSGCPHPAPQGVPADPSGLLAEPVRTGTEPRPAAPCERSGNPEADPAPARAAGSQIACAAGPSCARSCLLAQGAPMSHRVAAVRDRQSGYPDVASLSQVAIGWNAKLRTRNAITLSIPPAKQEPSPVRSGVGEVRGACDGFAIAKSRPVRHDPPEALRDATAVRHTRTRDLEPDRGLPIRAPFCAAASLRPFSQPRAFVAWSSGVTRSRMAWLESPASRQRALPRVPSRHRGGGADPRSARGPQSGARGEGRIPSSRREWTAPDDRSG